MARDIQPLTQADLPELSWFLAAGFQAPPGADFVAPEVLRKYLEPAQWAAREKEQDTTYSSEELTGDRETGTDQTLSYVARDDGGRIISHLGPLPNRLRGAGAHQLGRTDDDHSHHRLVGFS